MASLRKFLFDYDQLTSYCKQFRPKKDEDVNVSVLEVKQAELERRWSKITEHFEEGMTGEVESAVSEFSKVASSKFEEAGKAYQKCKAKMVELKESKIHPKAEETFRGESTIIQHGFSSLKLPPCDIQPFEDPHFFKPSSIDMIIGSDFLPIINLNGVRANIIYGLEARESQFGWYLSGPLPVAEVCTFSTSITVEEDIALSEQMKKFWELEEVSTVPQLSETDKYCEEFFKETTSRQPNGRYVVRLPFKSDYPNEIFLGRSKNIALAQYCRMEKTLEKNKELKTQYHEVLHEYLNLDHMEISKNYETPDEKQFSFFLPHHAVVRPDSKTTKLCERYSS
ncbi:uncharacterized protein [Musca autumnalis]|uniref:uncharacterized protein n=1 Tax=Musca autumnalis TaxID=221902 RepID=UPI003CEDC45C